MEKLNDYFLYDYDGSGLSNVFDSLSERLKEIHAYNQYVPNISSDTITYDGNVFSFTGIQESRNMDYDKRKNITSLAKLILGSYLSVANGFKDFSQVDDNWFIQNIDDICSTITDDDFNSDYFHAVFGEGSNEYYTDFLDRKSQTEALSGRENVNSYRKVLSNGASAFYAPETEGSEYTPDYTVEKKSANVTQIFYPLLIGLSLGTVMVMYFIFKYL